MEETEIGCCPDVVPLTRVIIVEMRGVRVNKQGVCVCCILMCCTDALPSKIKFIVSRI